MTECMAEGTTNPTPGTFVESPADCKVLWSCAHAFAYKRLSEGENGLDFNLLDCYSTRARRIAATYARFYLETEDGCDPAKKGRFYWMALGAFASKTVACILDSPQIRGSFIGGVVVDWVIPEEYELKQISEGLALGNLWLFMDIAVWHWAYANYPQHYFTGMECESKRNTDNLLDNCDGSGGVKTTVTKNLPWAEYALDKINKLGATSYVTEGMELAQKIEEIEDEMRPNKQLKHLQKIAQHEQEMILQKLIYNHSGFKGWLELERNIRQWSIEAEKRAEEKSAAYSRRLREAKDFWAFAWELFSPMEQADIGVELAKGAVKDMLLEYRFVYGAGCDTDDVSLKNVAPDDIELETLGSLNHAKQESPKSRMGWIGQVAEQFHGLMITRSPYMEGELGQISGWVDEADHSWDCIASETGAFEAGDSENGASV